MAPWERITLIVKDGRALATLGGLSTKLSTKRSRAVARAASERVNLDARFGGSRRGADLQVYS